MFLPAPREYLEILGVFLVVTTWGGGCKLAASGQKAGMGLDILQCPGQSTTKNYQVQNVNSTQAEKPQFSLTLDRVTPNIRKIFPSRTFFSLLPPAKKNFLLPIHMHHPDKASVIYQHRDSSCQICQLSGLNSTRFGTQYVNQQSSFRRSEGLHSRDAPKLLPEEGWKGKTVSLGPVLQENPPALKRKTSEHVSLCRVPY